VNTELIDAIDALLPQTQCTRCGYPACRPYAEAIAAGEAAINHCPPGGAAGIRKLAHLLGREETPLDPSNGEEKPAAAAVIDESRCIGCVLCIRACPVDAIVGAAKRMHTVLTAACTGCELCLAPCPVDCIEMVDLGALSRRGDADAAALARLGVEERAVLARDRYEFHRLRMARDAQATEARLAAKALAKLAHLDSLPGTHDLERKKATVRAAIERARARRAAHGGGND
jgi:Na+-translocating ferredoxin:NAD+ oxidoreductase subunit B